ncbi:MAG: NDP-sugar synthase [Bacteroidaceae bacterium]|nr:NDP-sugar synthase [Bacteroidaceae bacterium]
MKFAILAAGEGSRLAEEGIAQPKPLVPLLGEPMIDRLIRIFHSCEAESITIITNNLTPLTKEHLRQLQSNDPILQVIVKTTPSSMHSFYELMPLLGKGRFCLTTVDTIFREDEFREYIHSFSEPEGHSATAFTSEKTDLAANPQSSSRVAVDSEPYVPTVDGLMAVTDFVDDEKPLWVSTAPDLSITGFHDSYDQFSQSTAGKDGISVCRFISGGIYCLTDAAFPTLCRCIESGQSRMRNFQRALVSDGLHLKACPFTKILDVDHASDIIKAEAFLTTNKPL